MTRDLISKATPNDFCELLAGYTLREIEMVSDTLNATAVHASSLVQFKEGPIQGRVEKARQEIANRDSSGAIANAYTLVEAFLKQLLRKNRTALNESDGDIRTLYKLVAGPLNLAPKNESLESHLKAILKALQRQVGGLFEVANKVSDLQARRFNPAPHHAKLAASVAFTLCEFLVESYDYQQKREERRAS